MRDKLEQAVATVRAFADQIDIDPDLEPFREDAKEMRTVLAALKEAQERVGKKQDLIVALEALLVAYRLGSSSRADAALTKVEKARAALEPKR